MKYITWLIIGLIAGTIAKKITPQREPDSWLFSLGVGCAGSVVGGFLANILGLGTKNILGSIIIASVGAILVLYFYHRYNTRNN